MSFHHVAIATRDVKATHAFYTGPMGFSLAKVEVAPSGERGWAKHLFYDTGNGEMIAFWDLHDPELPRGVVARDLHRAGAADLGQPHRLRRRATRRPRRAPRALAGARRAT